MKSTAKNTILRFVIFLCILFLVFVYLNKVFTLPEEDENTKIFNSFYGETENSLDGIYLGSSAVNRFGMLRSRIMNTGTAYLPSQHQVNPLFCIGI